MNLTVMQLRALEGAAVAGALAGAWWLTSSMLTVLRMDAEYGTSHPIVFRPDAPPVPVPGPQPWQLGLAAVGVMALIILILFVLSPAIARARQEGAES